MCAGSARNAGSPERPAGPRWIQIASATPATPGSVRRRRQRRKAHSNVSSTRARPLWVTRRVSGDRPSATSPCARGGFIIPKKTPSFLGILRAMVGRWVHLSVRARRGFDLRGDRQTLTPRQPKVDERSGLWCIDPSIECSPWALIVVPRDFGSLDLQRFAGKNRDFAPFLRAKDLITFAFANLLADLTW